jgi:hypothetical protein
MNLKFATIALALVSGLAATPSFAFDKNSGSAADQAACTPDAWRVCGSAIPDANKVAACLADPKNKKLLSPACSKVMWPQKKNK